MALKFLNKKGWHTGSLRNIENVWKAEQKQEAEQKKLEEFKKQIQEERERHEFRLLQEQAGLVPKQERLEFLYDSGLAVGKSSSDGFKALETLPAAAETSNSASLPPSVPGALFSSAEKPQSANDTWRKLHSDPLLLIRQKEQEALSRIKNNPIKMDAIKKSVKQEEKVKHKKHQKHSRHRKHSKTAESGSETDDSEDGHGGKKVHRHDFPSASKKMDRQNDGNKRKERKKDDELYGSSTVKKDKQEMDRSTMDKGQHHDRSREKGSNHEDRGSERERERKRNRQDREEHDNHWKKDGREADTDRRERSRKDKYHSESSKSNVDGDDQARESRGSSFRAHEHHSVGGSDLKTGHPHSHQNTHRSGKLSEEEKAARFRQMQLDADAHDDQRWKRLKKASEADALEASQQQVRGRNFLDAAQKSIFGTEKGGRSTIAESVRERTFHLQGSSETDERNAFRR